MSYKTDLLNGNVFWTISTYHYSIIGFIDLIINIIYVNYFLSVVGLLFQLKGLNKMCFDIHNIS